MDDNQKKVLSALILIIYDAIKESGSDGIPSGHLYAMLMGKINLHVYQSVIDALVSTGKITNSFNLLKAV